MSIGDATPNAAAELRWCAWDADARTVTLAFESEAEMAEFVKSHEMGNRTGPVHEAAPDGPNDAAMLDWLETMANQRGGLLLHDGSELGRMGLGLRHGFLRRTLREAIAMAMPSNTTCRRGGV